MYANFNNLWFDRVINTSLKCYYTSVINFEEITDPSWEIK